MGLFDRLSQFDVLLSPLLISDSIDCLLSSVVILVEFDKSETKPINNLSASFFDAFFKDARPDGVLLAKTSNHSVSVLVLLEQDCVVLQKYCRERLVDPI